MPYSKLTSSLMNFLEVEPNHFTSLEVLNVHNPVPGDALWARHPQIFAGLTTLHMTFSTLQVSTLPPNLTSLYCNCSSVMLNETVFPDGLTKLTIFCRQSIPPFAFPAGLQYLSHMSELVDAEYIAQLPRGLTSLWIKTIDIDKNIVLALPPNVTSFESFCPIKAELIPFFPRSLKKMDFKGVLTQEFIECLPNLEVLSIGHDLKLHHSLISSLPASMRKLELTGSPKPTTTRLIESFPPRLETLLITTIGSDTIKKLPNTLTELTITFGPLLQESVALLPRNLKTLRVAGLIFEGSEMANYVINADLERIIYRITQQKGSSEALGNDLNFSALPLLPSTLTTLDISPIFGNLAPRGRPIQELSHRTAHHFSHLQSLQRLNISSICLVNSDVFGHFSSTINHISLEKITSMPMDTLKFLSPQVQYLSLSFVKCIPGLGKNMLATLPKFLGAFIYSLASDTRVTVADDEITNDDLGSLPASLYFLNLPHGAQLTHACLSIIHPGLNALMIGSSVPRWFSLRHMK